MNVEDFVTYEQALALKKLGFKERCFYHYDPDGVIYDNYYICNEVFQHVLSCQLCKSYNKEELNRLCDAPTLAQAQKWFRKEKYFDIDVIVDHSHNHLRDYLCDVYRSLDNNNRRVFCYHGWYETYEEALSVGINECLKLLEK